MSFLKRQRYPLMILVVLVLGCILVTYQIIHNDSVHVRTRENFIQLIWMEQTKPAEHHYQMLIQSLSELPDKTLLADYQRLAVLDLNEKFEAGSLLAKYRTAVENVLERRAQQRVQRMLKKSQTDTP